MDRVITEIAIRLLRNAVVHGIENPKYATSAANRPWGTCIWA